MPENGGGGGLSCWEGAGKAVVFAGRWREGWASRRGSDAFDPQLWLAFIRYPLNCIVTLTQ